MSGGQGVVSAGRQNGNRLFEAVIHPDEQDQKRAIDFGVQLDFSDGFARFVEKVSRTRDLLKLMGSSYGAERDARAAFERLVKELTEGAREQRPGSTLLRQEPPHRPRPQLAQ